MLRIQSGRCEMASHFLRLGVKRLVPKQITAVSVSQLLVNETFGFADLTLKVVLTAQQEDSSFILIRYLALNGHGHRSGLITSINHALNLLLQVGVFLA